MNEAGWYVDPESVHEARYWDGARWTDWANDDGVAVRDEMNPGFSGAEPQPLTPRFPPPPPEPPRAPSARISGGAMLVGGVVLFAISGSQSGTVVGAFPGLLGAGATVTGGLRMWADRARRA